MFYNVLGHYDYAKNHAVFYDIYLLTTDLHHEHDFELLVKMNNTDFKSKEMHYFSLQNKILGFVTKADYDWYYYYLDQNST